MVTEQVFDYDSLELREYHFKYKKVEYVLREPSADAAAQYRDKWMSCMSFGADGKPTKIVGMASVETLLVALCTFEKGEDGKEKAVAQGTIKYWPARMQKELFEKAKLFGELAEESPERQTLDEILSRDDSPVKTADFRKYIDGLPDLTDKHDYRPFKDWYKQPGDELAKNELGGMSATSD